MLGAFVEVDDQTKRMRYVSYAQICVYLDISKELPTGIKLSWQDIELIQDIDYEDILFRCRRCHDHLFRKCPQNQPQPEAQKQSGEKDAEGFEKVGNKRRPMKRHSNPTNPSQNNQTNRYEILNTIIEGETETEAGETQEDKPKEGN